MILINHCDDLYILHFLGIYCFDVIFLCWDDFVDAEMMNMINGKKIREMASSMICGDYVPGVRVVLSLAVQRDREMRPGEEV